MKPKRQEEHVKFAIKGMFVIDNFSDRTLKLILKEKNSQCAVDISVICLHDSVIENRDDFVFYNSHCRGNYSNREQEPFNPKVHTNKVRWRSQTQPMSTDGAIWLVEDWYSADAEEYYEDFVSLQLSKLNKSVTELLICAFLSDSHFTLNDVESLNVSLWDEECLKDHLRVVHTDFDIATNNILWQEYKGKLFESNIDLKGIDKNATIIASIKRKDNQFVFNNMEEFFPDIMTLLSKY